MCVISFISKINSPMSKFTVQIQQICVQQAHRKLGTMIHVNVTYIVSEKNIKPEDCIIIVKVDYPSLIPYIKPEDCIVIVKVDYPSLIP
uniref:Uncharacterized protein n=1 Tax=Rhizophora mucronata TaxID=61149 RepID=A0A2P2JJN5_RHIMU